MSTPRRPSRGSTCSLTESQTHLSVDNHGANQCYLVGPFLSGDRAAAEASLSELHRLCEAAGLTVAGGTTIHVRRITPSLYVGSGQADRIATETRESGAGVIVFDVPLSPVHLRNWARHASCEIYDRHAIILEIFARRARTRESQLQVELARAAYAQSHLAGMWQHLSRQGGGSRLARGEGEKQIEMDRRQLARRVQRARSDLKKVRRQRALRRQNRDGMFRVSLVGYTNAGKSSLLNALGNTNLQAADQLFATLDPATRRVYLGSDGTALISDTVGFIRNLPPELIEAFHSTLEEVLESDLLLLVLDASDASHHEQLETTLAILTELGAARIPRITILNKIDALQPGATESGVALDADAAEVLSVSARTGTGIPELRTVLARWLADYALVDSATPH